MPNFVQKISEVQTRQRRQWIWECISRGLLFGAGVSIGLGLIGLVTQGVLPQSYLILPVAIGSGVGLVVGMLTGGSARQAARAIDRVYGLKDRLETAMQFSHEDDPLRRLQVAEADTHAATVVPEQVVPYARPKSWTTAVALSVGALILLLLSNPPQPTVVEIEVNEVVERQADRLQKELEELKEFQAEEQNPELDQLVKELESVLELMKEPGVEPKEALAKLSEMEASLMQMQQQLDQQQTAGELAEIGEILSLSKEMAQAGEALSKGDFEKAAEELEKLEMPDLTRQTEKAISEQLKQLAENNKDGTPKSKTQDAASQMCEGLSQGNASKFKDGAQGLAGEAKKESRRKKLSELLRKQCQCLSECKGECEGECQNKSPGNSKAKGGKDWGLASSGNEPGDKTSKLGTSAELKLKGQESLSGDSEIETLAGDAQEQEALRNYRQVAENYEALSESVLNSESIPLGHRQTIRKYFQMIRPTNDETTQVNKSIE